MEYLTADWSETPLSRLGHGCELLGGVDWGDVDLEEAVAAVHAAYDAGVTVFDTADTYGLGRSETVLREALGRRLAEVVVVTKGGVAWKDEGSGRSSTYRDLSPDHLRSAVQASLRRLGLQRIPLYLAHWPDGVHPVEDVINTLDELRQDGLVGAFGLSNFSADELAHPGVLDRIAAIEVEHSLVAPHHDVIDLAGTQERVSLLYGVLGQGLLTGRYRAGTEFPSTDRRHRLRQFTVDNEARRDLFAELARAAAALELTSSQVAIRWAISSGPRTCAVVGARTTRQLEQNIAAVGALPHEQTARLTAAAHLYLSRQSSARP